MKKVLYIYVFTLLCLLCISIVTCSIKWQDRKDKPIQPNPCYEYELSGADPLVYTILDGVKLSIPQGVVRRAYPSDADINKCIPRSIMLKFAFNTQTKELINNRAKEKAFIEYQIITLTITGWSKIPEPIMDNIDVLKVYNPNRLNDPKRYQPKYKMAYYPLWFYPNAFYDNSPSTEGYGVVGTNNPFTNQPYLISCSFHPSSEPNNGNKYQNKINATIVEIHYTCLGSYQFLKDNIFLDIDVWIQPKAVKHIDVIYQQIDELLASYILIDEIETIEDVATTSNINPSTAPITQ